MLKALRNRSIALLWSGQALSSIGDEIYRVALIWIAIGLIGPDTGYLAAGQAAALLLLSLIGGKWADRWDRFLTLIWVDAIRCALVLLPVVLAPFHPISLSLLLFVALSVSALGAFFDPALQAVLPRFATDPELLQAANGLMATTLRLARVVGPGMIGLITAYVPMLHFFTIDAASFAASALSIGALGRPPERRRQPRPARVSYREAIVAGFALIRESPQMRFTMFAKAWCGGAWSLAYTMGLALFVHKMFPDNVRVFGLLIASYGVGNLGGALILGNLPRKKPALLLFAGYVMLGSGFFAVALAPNLGSMMAASAFAAFGGVMNDLPFIDLLQNRYPIEELPTLFRLRIAAETAATLLCMLASPFLFRVLPIQAVIAGSGVSILIVGIAGLALFSERPLPQRELSALRSG